MAKKKTSKPVRRPKAIGWDDLDCPPRAMRLCAAAPGEEHDLRHLMHGQVECVRPGCGLSFDLKDPPSPRLYFLPSEVEPPPARTKKDRLAQEAHRKERLAAHLRLKRILDTLSYADATFVEQEMNLAATAGGVAGIRPFRADIQDAVEARRNRRKGPKTKQERDAAARDVLDAAFLAEFNPRTGVKSLEIPKPLVKGKSAGNWSQSALYESRARLMARGLLPAK